MHTSSLINVSMRSVTMFMNPLDASLRSHTYAHKLDHTHTRTRLLT